MSELPYLHEEERQEADRLASAFDERYFAMMRRILETVPVSLIVEPSKPIGEDYE